jgi:hypothetical protein
MNDLKSHFIAGISASPSFVFALAEPGTLAIITSIVLPIVFFVLSKAVDVLVQIYFRRQKEK